MTTGKETKGRWEAYGRAQTAIWHEYLTIADPAHSTYEAVCASTPNDQTAKEAAWAACQSIVSPAWAAYRAAQEALQNGKEQSA